MSDFDVKEKRFEEDIEDYLTHHGGYTKGDPKKFNRESGLDEDTFVEFIKTSQPKKWERSSIVQAQESPIRLHGWHTDLPDSMIMKTIRFSSQ